MAEKHVPPKKAPYRLAVGIRKQSNTNLAVRVAQHWAE